MAERETPSPMRFDEERRLRVVTEVASLSDLACPAFAAIARYGIRDADVVAKLLDTMEMLVRAAPRSACSDLTMLMEEIRHESQNKAPFRHDRKSVHAEQPRLP